MFYTHIQYVNADYKYSMLTMFLLNELHLFMLDSWKEYRGRDYV